MSDNDLPALTLDEEDLLPSSIETPIPAVDNFDPVKAAEELAERTVILELHIRKPGFTKTLSAEHFMKTSGEPEAPEPTREIPIDVEEDEAAPKKKARTDPDLLHVQQDILDREEIAEIGKHDERFLTWLKHPSRRVPYRMLASGLYLVFIDCAEEIDKALTVFLEERRGLINKFGSNYKRLQEDAKLRRGPYYDPADYPPFSTIRAKYRVEARYLSFNVPAALERVSSAVYEKAKQQAQMEWIDAAQDARDAQRMAWDGLIKMYTDMLGVDEETGKRKSFKPSVAKKLEDFLKMFDRINLVQDGDLEAVVKQARELIKGIEPKDLKKDGTLRDTLEAGFKQLAERSSSLIVTQKRMYSFEDEDAEDAEDGEAELEAASAVTA